jgi:hypothetical protein
LLALGAFAFGRRRGGIANASPVQPPTEKSPC